MRDVAKRMRVSRTVLYSAAYGLCAMMTCSTTSTRSGGTSRRMCPRTRDAASSPRKYACPVAPVCDPLFRRGMVWYACPCTTKTREPEPGTRCDGMLLPKVAKANAELRRTACGRILSLSKSLTSGVRLASLTAVTGYFPKRPDWHKRLKTPLEVASASQYNAPQKRHSLDIVPAERYLVKCWSPTSAAARRAKPDAVASRRGAALRRIAVAGHLRFLCLSVMDTGFTGRPFGRATFAALARRRSVRSDTWLASGSRAKRLALARRRSVRSDTWLASGSRAKRFAAARRCSVRSDTWLASGSRAKRFAAVWRCSVRSDTWLASGSRAKRFAAARRRSVRSDTWLASGSRAKRFAAARRCSVRSDTFDGAALSSTVASA